jgi:dihydroflavonol-4-reductase
MLTLVTGGTGYLGAELVRELEARGRAVRILARSPERAAAVSATAEVAVGDVTRPETLPAALEGVDRVFHLAGHVGHRAADEPLLTAVNVAGSAALLEAAARAGTGRVVYASSVAAMGPAGRPDRPRDERHFLLDGDDGRGDFRYARSKAQGERHALDAAAAGQDVVVANPGFVIGPGDVNRVSSWPIEEYLRGVLRAIIHGGLSYVDARDVVAGLLAAEERGAAGERYILTAPDGNRAHGDFFDLVGRVAGKRRRQVRLPVGLVAPPLALARVLHLPLVPLDEDELRSSAYWWFYDGAKARDQLGFTTRPLDETVADTIAWLRADGYRRH